MKTKRLFLRQGLLIDSKRIKKKDLLPRLVVGKCTQAELEQYPTAKLLNGKKFRLRLETIGGDYPGHTIYAVFKGQKIHIGFIERGHRQVLFSKRSKVYSQALRMLEEMEKKQIKAKGYERYRERIIQEMEVDHTTIFKYLGFSENVPFLRSLKKPCFIDYAKQYDAAIALLKNGYSLTPVSLEGLRQKYPKIGWDKKSLITFFKTNYNKLNRVNYDNRVLLVFTKPIQ